MSAVGRPTKYRKEYCQKILDFFSITPTKIIEETVITKMGIKLIKREVANRLPTIEGFAISIEVSKPTVIGWTKHHQQFFNAYMRAKDHAKEILIQNGLASLYNEGFAKFVAINCTDMVDKAQHELTGKDGAPIIPTNLVINFVEANASPKTD